MTPAPSPRPARNTAALTRLAGRLTVTTGCLFDPCPLDAQAGFSGAWDAPGDRPLALEVVLETEELLPGETVFRHVPHRLAYATGGARLRWLSDTADDPVLLARHGALLYWVSTRPGTLAEALVPAVARESVDTRLFVRPGTAIAVDGKAWGYTTPDETRAALEACDALGALDAGLQAGGDAGSAAGAGEGEVSDALIDVLAAQLRPGLSIAQGRADSAHDARRIQYATARLLWEVLAFTPLVALGDRLAAAGLMPRPNTR